MTLHWDDPEWKAEHLRKMREGIARRKKARDAAQGLPPVNESVTAVTPPQEDDWAKIAKLASEPVPAPEPKHLTFSEVTTSWDSDYQSSLYACGCGVRISSNQPFDMPAYCPVHGEALALKLLRQMWRALRLRTAGVGFMKDRCSACNIPHPRGECRHRCPCHQIAMYLELIDAAPVPAEEIPADGNR